MIPLLGGEKHAKFLCYCANNVNMELYILNFVVKLHIELTGQEIQRVSKRMTRFQIIVSNNENVLQLQNKLQTIKQILKFHSP